MLIPNWLSRLSIRGTTHRRRDRRSPHSRLIHPSIARSPDVLEDRTLLSAISLVGSELWTPQASHGDCPVAHHGSEGTSEAETDRHFSRVGRQGLAGGARSLHGLPDLPGLTLVDPATNASGQIMFLDFDGAEDVIYNGPVTVGPFDVPAFQAPGELAGQEAAIIDSVVEQLEQTFDGSGVTFTTEQPAEGVDYSTIYIGGDDSAFGQYGSFLGLAEEVDVANVKAVERAFVFSDALPFAPQEPHTFGLEMAEAVAHESAHILGFTHDTELARSPLASVALTETFSATKDAYISKSASTLNFGSSDVLDVWHPLNQIEYRALVYTPVNSIPSGSIVSSATLALRATSENDGLVRLHRVTRSWSESTVTWDNQPTHANSQISQQWVTQTGLVTFDVTQLAQDWVNGDKNNRGFMLKGNSGQTIFNSRESGDDTPALIVNYTEPDNPPHASLTLSPGTIDTAGVSTFMRVEYSDDQSIDMSTLDSNDILVTGPNSYSRSATFLTVDNENSGTPREATYEVIPAGGRWDDTDNGTYTMTLRSDQVEDNVGQAAETTTLGTFTIAIPEHPDQAGNTPSDARNIGTVESLRQFTDWVGPSDGNDFYAFSLANTFTEWQLDLSLTGLSRDVDVELYAAGGETVLGRSVHGGAQDEDISTVLSGGASYYVRVFPYRSAASSYTLSVSATAIVPTDRVGNDAKNASDLGAIEGDVRTQSEWVGPQDGDDYYRFVLPAFSAQWTIGTTLTGLTGNADIALLNVDESVIWEGNNGGTVDESDSRTLDAGTYFLRIFPGSNSAASEYQVNLSVSPVDQGQTIFDLIDFGSSVGGNIRQFLERAADTTWATIQGYMSQQLDIDVASNLVLGFRIGVEAKASAGEVIYLDIAEAKALLSVLYDFGEFDDANDDTWTISRGFEIKFDTLISAEIAGEEYLVVPATDSTRPIVAGVSLSGAWATDLVQSFDVGIKKGLDVTYSTPGLELGRNASVAVETTFSEQEFLTATGQSSLALGIADSFGFVSSSIAEFAIGAFTPLGRPLLSTLGLGDDPLGLLVSGTTDLRAVVSATTSLDASLFGVNAGVGVSAAAAVSAGVFLEVVAAEEFGTAEFWHQTFQRSELAHEDDVGNSRVEGALLEPFVSTVHSLSSEDRDAFAFNSAAGQLHEFTVSPGTAGEVRIVILDSLDRVLRQVTVSGSPETIAFRASDAGQYYIFVDGVSETTTGEYGLGWVPSAPDGSFSNGLTGFTDLNDNRVAISDLGNGDFAALLREQSPVTLRQRVEISSDKPLLGFEYRVTAAGDGDTLDVRINETTVHSIPLTEIQPGFVVADPIDLSAYAGQTVDIDFHLNSVNQPNAAFEIDNISLYEAVTTGPQVGITDDSGNASDLAIVFAETLASLRSDPSLVQLINSGDDLLIVSDIQIAGAGGGDFRLEVLNAEDEAVEHSNVSFEVAPGQVLQMRAFLEPQPGSTGGLRSGAIQFETNDIGAPAVEISLGGLVLADEVSPEATGDADDITQTGSTHEIRVTFSDNALIDVSEIGSGDVFVTGPNGYLETPSFSSMNPDTNAPSVVATYNLAAPGGSWDSLDNGSYTVKTSADEIQDTNGNMVEGGIIIGSFDVNVPNAGPVITPRQLSDQLLNAGGSVVIPFSVTDRDGDPLTVTASADDPGLVAVQDHLQHEEVTAESGRVQERTVDVRAGSTLGRTRVTVTADDGQARDSETFDVGVGVRLNAGGPELGSDDDGPPFLPFSGGNSYPSPGPVDTSDPSIPASVPNGLFQNLAWASGGMTFRFPVVPQTTFQVDLLFAELWNGAFENGARVFDVVIEGETVINDLDVYREVGALAGLGKTEIVTVDDSFLDIVLRPEVQNPIISGLIITPLSSNERPVVPPGQRFRVDENALNGTVVGTPEATDPDGDPLQDWRIESQSVAGAFAIDSSSGQITVAAANRLDYEQRQEHELLVSVSDTKQRSRPETVTVELTNLNDERPVVTPGQEFSVAENGTVVGTVQATDADGPTTFQDWMITDSNNSAFMIDPSTGQITVADNSNLSPTMSEPLMVSVTVSDGSNTSLSGVVSIEVTEVNDPPEITRPASEPASVSLGENQRFVVDVESTDPEGDTEGDGLSYRLTYGADGSVFSIDPDTGILGFNTPPDFENPSDADGDNVYEVQVTVTDSGGLTDERNMRVTVTDVNEPPRITSPGGVTIPENQRDVVDVESTDPEVDTEGDGLSYSLTAGADGSLFSIDPDTGILTFKTAPDFENPGDADGNNVYEVQVTVTDSGDLAGMQDLQVTVTDVNDNAPDVSVLLTDPAPAIPEGTTRTRVKVGDIVVSDADSTVIFDELSLSGDEPDVSLFEIVGMELFVQSGVDLDFATNPALEVSVCVDDSTLGESPDNCDDPVSVPVIINRLPEFDPSPFRDQLLNAGGSVVIPFSVTDRDGDSLTVTAVADDPVLVTVQLENQQVTEDGLTVQNGTLHVRAGSTLGRTRVTVTADDGMAEVDEPFEVNVGLRINAGGRVLESSDGSPPFLADDGYQNGVGNDYGTEASINGSDPSVPDGVPASVFQSVLWDAGGGDNLEFDVGLIRGNAYHVTLLFSEIYGPAFAAGARSFSVDIDGVRVLSEFDVFAAANEQGNVGVGRTISFVSDGRLDIDLIHGTQNPAIAGFVIHEVDEAFSNPTLLNDM